jgi:hypothetical protein
VPSGHAPVCWGHGANGRLGNNNATGSVNVPTAANITGAPALTRVTGTKGVENPFFAILP